MALARVGIAGLLVFVACLIVGHSTAAPSTTQLVAVAPVTTTTVTVAPTTIPPPPPVVHASRGATRPRPTLGAATAEQQQEAIAEICAYDWPCDRAVRVAECESGLRWWAQNAHGRARGIFQVLGGPLDLKAGVALAHGMWVSRGWGPWAASRRCWT